MASMGEYIFETVKDKELLLAEQVAGQIRQLIIDRQLTNGEKLPNEFELAQQLNVGRGTVREAVSCWLPGTCWRSVGGGTLWPGIPVWSTIPSGFAYMPDQLRLAHELLDIRLNMEPWVAFWRPSTPRRKMWRSCGHFAGRSRI